VLKRFASTLPANATQLYSVMASVKAALYVKIKEKYFVSAAIPYSF
jgi:hypothetical protein